MITRRQRNLSFVFSCKRRCRNLLTSKTFSGKSHTRVIKVPLYVFLYSYKICLPFKIHDSKVLECWGKLCYTGTLRFTWLKLIPVSAAWNNWEYFFLFSLDQALPYNGQSNWARWPQRFWLVPNQVSCTWDCQLFSFTTNNSRSKNS